MEEQTITVIARAKINLTIDVVGKRPDGFHEVCMVMQAINLFDELKLTIEQGNATRLDCIGRYWIPCDKRNIVCSAVDAFKEATQQRFGVKIFIKKNIPTQAGLGGGSADAAAVLTALNAAFERRLSTDCLQSIGASVGSDVPFMFAGGTALVTGRGERLMPLKHTGKAWTVLIKPDFGISTAYAYSLLGQASVNHPDTVKLAEQLDLGVPMEQLIPYTGNVLEAALLPHFPMIGEYKSKLIACGAYLSMLSGSGSVVYGLFTDEMSAKKACSILRKELDCSCYCVPFCENGVEII